MKNLLASVVLTAIAIAGCGKVAWVDEQPPVQIIVKDSSGIVFNQVVRDVDGVGSDLLTFKVSDGSRVQIYVPGMFVIFMPPQPAPVAPAAPAPVASDAGPVP